MVTKNVFPVAEVAARYHVSKATVMRAIQTKRLKAHKIGWIWVVGESDLPASWEDLKPKA